MKTVRNTYLIALLGLCTLGLTAPGCTDSESTTPDDGRTMRFAAYYPGQEAAQASRATASGFEHSDVLGLYVTDATGTLQLGGNEVNNASMTYDGSAWKPGTTVYWNEGKQYNVYAYYPYIANPNSVEDCTFAVQTDQSTERTSEALGGYEASDFLWASKKGVAPSADPVPLTFKHRMSQLKVTLVKGTDYDGDLPDNKDMAVYVHNTITDCTVDFASGFVTKDPRAAGQTIRACAVGDHAFAAIVVPQRVETILPLVEVVMKGVSYMVESRFNFKMGIQHNMTVTISKNPEQIKIEIGGEITDWEKDN